MKKSMFYFDNIFVSFYQNFTIFGKIIPNDYYIQAFS